MTIAYSFAYIIDTILPFNHNDIAYLSLQSLILCFDSISNVKSEAIKEQSDQNATSLSKTSHITKTQLNGITNSQGSRSVSCVSDTNSQREVVVECFAPYDDHRWDGVSRFIYILQDNEQIGYFMPYLIFYIWYGLYYFLGG